MIKATTYGDFNKVTQRLKKLKRIEAEYKAIMIQAGDITSALISEIIRSNSIQMEALSSDYAEKKRKEGYSGNILVRTSQFVDNIRITEIRPESNGIHVKVSVPPIDTDTNANLLEIAVFHEYGTKNMPARRPIGKSWEKIEDKIRALLENEIRAMLERAIR